MGKIPPVAVIAIVLVLIIGVAVGVFFVLIKPAQAELSDLQGELEQVQSKADKLESAKQELIKVTGHWLGADTKLQKLMDKRSIKLSFAHPLPALFASLWPEMRRNLADTVEQWVRDHGVKIISGDSIPAPPSLPPTPPASGFYQLARINLGIEGTLSDIEKLYRALPEFPRIATIEGLSLSGQGSTIRATLPMTIYLLVEVPPDLAAAGAAGAGMMGAMGGYGMPGAPPVPGGMPTGAGAPFVPPPPPPPPPPSAGGG